MNESALLSRRNPGKLKTVIACLALASVVSLAPAMAGTDMKEITPPTCGSCSEKDWTIELGSGVGFSNVRSGQPNQAYTIVPISLMPA